MQNSKKRCKLRLYDYRNSDKQLYTKEIVQLLTAIHEYRGKQEHYLETKKDVLGSLLNVAKIQSTGASNRIEGIYTSEKRLHAIVAQKNEPLNRDEEEIAGYREVLNTIHENYGYINISPDIIMQLHRDLYSFSSINGGNYKNQDNFIEEIDTDGSRNIRFKPVSTYLVKDSMTQMCIAFSEAFRKEQIDPLLIIPQFILDFLCIHPFNDGNGRMGRLLTLLLLYKKDFVVGKYISIEMIIEKTKKQYYETLRESSRKWHENQNDYKPFVKYSLAVILKAYKELSERLSVAKNMNKSERIKHIFQTKTGKIMKADIAKIYPDISVTTIEKELSELLKSGYIKKIGGGRSTGYVRSFSDEENP
jgi:Fic family protein